MLSTKHTLNRNDNSGFTTTPAHNHVHRNVRIFFKFCWPCPQCSFLTFVYISTDVCTYIIRNLLLPCAHQQGITIKCLFQERTTVLKEMVR